jgi:hypothetical protein
MRSDNRTPKQQEVKPDPSGLTALSGLEIVEIYGPTSTPLGSVAAAFTGMLAARLGATVNCVESAHRINLDTWPPFASDGSSALSRFLSTDKRLVAASFEPNPNTYLLTDDATVAASWPDERIVLASPKSGPEQRWHSEISAMAASGLLDIVGEPGRPPLPLPGNQMAYATGLAALVGLLASYHAELALSCPVRVRADVVEVGSWLNWKNRLSAVSGNRQTGRERREEWRAVRCKDGYIAVIFRDRDIPNIATLMRSERLRDEIFSKESSRLDNLPEFFDIVSQALANREKSGILQEAGELGLQFSAVLSPVEVHDDPQMRFREFFSNSTHTTVPRLPIIWTR